MRIAILTSGILPVPAVQGGAVENLIDFYLEYNDQHHLHDITVYSVWHPDITHHPALQSKVNHYRYITVHTQWAKIKKKYCQLTHGEEYYHHTIEYFLHEAMKHLCRQDYDIIILENRPGYALKIPPKYPAKLVYHIHNDFLNAQTRQAQEIYDRADSIITVSDYIKSRVLTIDDLDKKCKTVLNGIDLKTFSDHQPQDRKSFGLAEDDFVIVFSGRLIEEKGIRQLLLAMQELKDYPDIKLMIVGGSFYGNGIEESPFIQELQALVSSLEDRVIFTGFKPYREIPSLLTLADIAALPSIWDEPLGLTCIEAMATGLPVITTNKGGIPETVTPDCGLLLDVTNTLPHQLAESILTLYQHPEKRKAMGEISKQHSQLFSKERYAKNFFEALESITS